MSSSCPECVYHNVDQNTDAWQALRLGRVTASSFVKWLTQKLRLSDSQTAESYMLDVVGEIISGRNVEIPTTKAMQWGHDTEPIAREVYEHITGHDVADGGFVSYGERFGCSPDGLIGDDGGLEIKCPFTIREHLRVVLERKLPPAHRLQVLSSLWMTGREWWDYCSYHPAVPNVNAAMFVTRVEMSDSERDAMQQAAESFAARIDRTLQRLEVASGYSDRTK